MMFIYDRKVMSQRFDVYLKGTFHEHIWIIQAEISRYYKCLCQNSYLHGIHNQFRLSFDIVVK
jgi:hypothetical protein